MNYTTYDVHHDQNTLNPNSDHRDIMMLWAGCTAGTVQHRFCYTCVISIYHANVLYTGPGLKDYITRRLDFLHVQWFRWILPNPQYDAVELDKLRFLPITDENVFNFIDPADIMRACHLIPTFMHGKSHSDCTALSLIVRDSDDWNYYYFNWYDEFPNTHLS